MKHLGSRRLGVTQIGTNYSTEQQRQSTLSNSTRTDLCDPDVCISSRTQRTSPRTTPTPGQQRPSSFSCSALALPESQHPCALQRKNRSAPPVSHHTAPHAATAVSVCLKGEGRARLTFQQSVTSVSLSVKSKQPQLLQVSVLLNILIAKLSFFILLLGAKILILPIPLPKILINITGIPTKLMDTTKVQSCSQTLSIIKIYSIYVSHKAKRNQHS